MKALVWKEWQESKRPFFGGLITLTGLPFFLLVVYRLFVDDDWLFGMPTVLAMFFGPVIAAAWGAHLFTKDLAGQTGRFLIAQPVCMRRIVCAKGAVAAVLLAALLLIPRLLDFALWYSVARRSMDWVGFSFVHHISYVLALTGVLGMSFLAATVFRRLIPAVLVGLAGGVCVAFFFVMSQALVLAGQQKQWVWLLFGGVGAALCVVTFLAAAVVARPGDRPAFSLRALAWIGVIVVLAGTAWVTGTVGNNTVVTCEIDAEVIQHRYIGHLWARGNSLYWLEFGPHWGPPDPGSDVVRAGATGMERTGFIKKATFNDTGALIEASQTAAMIPVVPFRNLFEPKLDREAKNVTVLYSPKKDPRDCQFRLTRYELGAAEAVAHQLGCFDSWTSPWALDGDRLFQIQPSVFEDANGTRRHAIKLQIVSLAARKQTISELQFTKSIYWPQQMEIKDGVLSLWSAHVYAPEHGEGHLVRADVSDPRRPRVILESHPFPRESALLGTLFGNRESYHAVAVQGDRLATASVGGLWLHELGPHGEWKLLGKREASLIEILAGRWPRRLIWQGDRIYEMSHEFGILIYDVSDVSRPRRIGHCAGGWFDQVAVLDNGCVALLKPGSDGKAKLEIHRLPRR